MRIIFVNRFFYPDHSATSQMLTDLAFQLAADDFDVEVVTSRQRIDEPSASLPPRETVNRVQVHRVWSSRFGRGHFLGRPLDYLSFHFGARWRLRRLCRAGDVLVSKTDPPLLSVTAGRVARQRGAAHCTWLQDLFPEVATALGVAGLGGRIGRTLEGWRDRSLREAAMNVAIGEGMASRVLAAGVEPGRVRIIHNWCDGEAVRPRSRESCALRREWGHQGRFVVGYSGNLGLAHEFDTLLRAAIDLADDERFCFLLIGGGRRIGALREAVVSRGLANVVFEDYQPRERLADSLAVADVHLVSLLPELEGLIVPSKIYGVLAAGRPAIHIGAPDGEVARIVGDAGCGAVVGCGDGPGLVKLLRELADDPGRCEAMGVAARRAFERRYSMVLGLDAWRQTLRRLAASQSDISM